MDDPYKPPASALTERGEPTTPLSRIDEAMIDFMRASRPRTIVFIALAGVGCLASIVGLAEGLFLGTLYGGLGPLSQMARAVVWGLVLAHCALAALGLARYLAAVNRVVRTNDRRDLELALRRRALARVGLLVMIALFMLSIFLPLFYLD